MPTPRCLPLVAILVAAGALSAAPAGAVAAPPLKIASPGAGALVRGDGVPVVVRARSNVSNFRAWLDGRDVTARLRGTGARRAGRLRGLTPGVGHLAVRARVGGRLRYAHARFVVRGQRRSLLSFADPGGGVLRYAADGGVGRMAFRAPVDATVRARLNGRRVPLRGPDAKGVRRAVLSRSDGLRRGRNALRLVAFYEDGRYDARRRTITVDPAAPMAATGHDTTHTAGDRLALDARGTDPGSDGSRLSYQWRVVQAPPRARAAVVKPSSPRTSLKLRRPGHYIVALTATEHRRDGSTLRSTDLHEADVLAATPPLGARLDTMAADPQGQAPGDGVLVDMSLPSGGGTGAAHWYAGPGAGDATVFAFDPQSLRPPGGFDGRLDRNDPDGSLKTALAGLTKGDLVVIVGRDGCCGGGKLLPAKGAFSYVFAYDGQGTTNFGKTGTWNKGLVLGTPGRPGKAGALTGFFREDEHDDAKGNPTQRQFRYVADGRVPFSTAVLDQPTLNPSDGATYRIRAANGNNLDVAGDAGAQGPLATKTPSNADSQQWQMRRAYGQYFQLVNVHSGLCANLSGSDGKSLLQWACSPDTDFDLNELWLPYKPAGASAFTLRSALSAASPVAVTTTGDASGSAVIVAGEQPGAQGGQGFTFELAPGAYTFADPDSGKVLGEPAGGAGDGPPLEMQAPEDTAAQRFVLTYDDGTSRFKLVNAVSGKCVDVRGGTPDPGTIVERYACDPNGPDQLNERWTAAADSEGVSLKSAAGDAVMSRRKDQVVVDRDEYTGQRWRLQRLPALADGNTFADARQITFRVGAQQYSTLWPGTMGGFVAMAVDSALRPIDGNGNVMTRPEPQDFPTNNIGAGPSIDAAGVFEFVEYLDDVARIPGATVFVQSIGRPKPTNDSWNLLAAALGKLGGDVSQVLKLDGTGDYALVGCTGCGGSAQPAFVEALRRSDNPGLRGARLNGTLGRDGQSTYRAEAATAAQLDPSFGTLAARAQAAWPLDDGKQGTAALKWIADDLGIRQTCDADLGPVRNAYCVANVGGDTTWGTRIALLPGYPTGRTDFDKPTYDAVVAQLKWEWNALDDVHSMFAGLETAYSWAGSSQGTASTIATTITNNMGRPVQRGSSAAGGIISLVQDTLTVATEFGPLLAAQPALPGGGDDDDPAGPATKIAALLGLGNDIMQLAGGNDGGSDAVSIDGIRADALDYAAQLDPSSARRATTSSWPRTRSSPTRRASR